MTMEEMQRQLARQQSRADIMNLMGRYQYYHTGGEMSRIGRGAVRLLAARCPGVSTAPWGCSAQRSLCSFSTP